MNIHNQPPSRTATSGVWEYIRNGMLIGAVVGGLAVAGAMGFRKFAHPAGQAPAAQSQPAALAPPRFASFGNDIGSPDAQHVANWVADSHDNGNYDFVIVDKKYARVFVFDADARLRASTPVLLGAASGDDSVPGIGTRPIADIRVEERTTPAGRFVGERGRNATNEEVVWVDYANAVSMHRVRPLVASERRLERLDTPGVEDNRISWGCINVPVAFFDAYISPMFAKRKAVVYVLPETKPVQQVFHSYDVASKYHVARADSVSLVR